MARKAQVSAFPCAFFVDDDALPEADGLPENAVLTVEPFYSHVQHEY